jgi:ribosomal protein S3
MENNKLNTPNSLLPNMNEMVYPSTHLSSFEGLMVAQEVMKDTQEILRKRGVSSLSVSALDGLKKKIVSLRTLKNKLVKKLTKDFFSPVVFNELMEQSANYLTFKNDKVIKIANQKMRKQNNKNIGSFLRLYTTINTEIANEGLFNLPKTILNKHMKKMRTFDTSIAGSHNIFYKYNNNVKDSIQNIYTLLVSSLNPAYVLNSRPQIVKSANKVKITLFVYSYVLKSKNLKKSTSSFIVRNEERLRHLCENLSQLYKTYVSLELVRVYHPTSESNILANFISSVSNKKPFRIVKKRMLRRSKLVNPSKILDSTENEYNHLFETKNITPGNLTGINVKVAGRLLTERIVPRKTVRAFQNGSLSRGKANIVNVGRSTRKNRRGCFSVTVKTGHIVY